MDKEKETIILEKLSRNTAPVRQRELAEIADLSLGMTNGLLKRMAEKGFLMMEKVNSRNIKYILTAEGRHELNSRTQKYMKRTIKNVVYYREAVEEMVQKASEDDFEGVCLIGRSDLDFILEWACQRYNLKYIKDTEKEGYLTVYSERGTRGSRETVPPSSVYLNELDIQGELSK